VVLLAISGLFSATFTLTFAYVSDTVPKGEKRVAAYGLAVCFLLSNCLLSNEDVDRNGIHLFLCLSK